MGSEVISSSRRTIPPAMPPRPSCHPTASGTIRAPSSDAVVQLATLLNLWLMQGSPADQLHAADGRRRDRAPGMPCRRRSGAQLTNIGSCVPNKAAVGTSADAMDQLDALFAQATAAARDAGRDRSRHPGQRDAGQDRRHLLRADLSALERQRRARCATSACRAANRSLFDKATQKFSIPANTRFYKTFLKQVTDANGNPTYRKIETRLIVSRPDTTMPDGTAQQNALFGTYVWNEDESQATLLDRSAARRQAVRRSALHLRHRRGQGQGHHRQQPRQPAGGARTPRGSRATTRSRAPSAASSATWAAPASPSFSGSRRCRWRAGRTAKAASTSRRPATS